MKFDLKKSLFVSMAALGLIAAAGVANAQPASAKTYARVTMNRKMSTDPTTRNVTFTGNNALYTKAGTLRGARVVARTGTLNSLAKSGSSSDNFRAYRVATTNRNSVYYKIVSYDGNYRGWIYGGKSTGTFGGGITQFNTFQTGTITDAMKNSTYKFANTGVANDGKTVTYVQPAWTQYKVGRAILDSSPYTNATFKIDQTGTRTREGDQWVHITAVDTNNSAANGWILFSGLTQAQTPIADNAIRINLVDPSNNNNVVKSFDWSKTGVTKDSLLGTQSNGNWTIASGDQSAIQSSIRNALNGTGFNLDTLTNAQLSALAQAKFGGSINLNVNKATAIADNAVRINIMDSNGNVIKSFDYNKSGATKGTPLGSQVNGNWTLAGNDQTQIQNQINSTLNGTGYNLTLTSAQISQIAQATFGNGVYISANSNAQIADTVARINFVNPSGTTVGHIDFTKSGAAKGNPVGTWNGSAWVLSDTDANSINNSARNVLNALGYALPNNGNMSDAQRAIVASTRFGTSTNLNVLPTSSAYSTIQPRGYDPSNFLGSKWTSSALRVAPSNHVAVTQPFPGTEKGSYSATDLYNLSDADKTAFNNIVKNYSAQDINSLNKAFKADALGAYVIPSARLSFTTGPQGTSFTAASLNSYLTTNGLTTLKSADYPVFVQGTGLSSFGNITYTLQTSDTDGGTNGSPVNAYYSYNSSNN
ncbi:hypothetical protein [Lentilactobacillus diolivorans]|uniref:Surface layer protein SlpB n=2 Tax=Lentilactobacillus diolivorans TaxID=179838 RepID=A0A0R1SNJ2_9LACO|nr:hypothetical protein [Lentilactobacillus diolivorans]KRL67795.1 surface layer protein SlpB [Lentilactobacillus diolivorans DSM 14421]GEP22932.1 hypothetical protein LDI01_05250 [Lentilactobacillus diolivorans]